MLVVEDEKCLAAGLRYDAIVLDIMLPEVSGYQVCAALRWNAVVVAIVPRTAVITVDAARTTRVGR